MSEQMKEEQKILKKMMKKKQDQGSDPGGLLSKENLAKVSKQAKTKRIVKNVVRKLPYVGIPVSIGMLGFEAYHLGKQIKDDLKRNKKIKPDSKKTGGSTDFGMLSVKYGIDNNPNPTQADRIAGATKGKKPKTADAGTGKFLVKGMGAAIRGGLTKGSS